MKHILFTLKGCPFHVLNDEAYIRGVLFNAAEISHSTLLNVASHKFEPHGVTAVALLAESHISIHTWPEDGMAVCDVFTCGEHTNPTAASVFMFDALESKSHVTQTFERPLE